MNKEMKIRTELHNKLQTEYKEFIDNLKQQSPEKIIESSYEKVMKEETLYMFYPESGQFDLKLIKALNKTKAPLDELYQGWMDCDLNLNQLYEDSVRETLYTIFEEQTELKKEKQNER